jgi:hypothetical protein
MDDVGEVALAELGGLEFGLRFGHVDADDELGLVAGIGRGSGSAVGAVHHEAEAVEAGGGDGDAHRAAVVGVGAEVDPRAAAVAGGEELDLRDAPGADGLES